MSVKCMDFRQRENTQKRSMMLNFKDKMTDKPNLSPDTSPMAMRNRFKTQPKTDIRRPQPKFPLPSKGNSKKPINSDIGDLMKNYKA